MVVHELASILLSIDADQLSFPNEEAAAAVFFLVSLEIFLFTQPLSMIYKPH